MQNATRTQYAALLQAMAQTYGVPSAAQRFAIEEPVSIRLNDAIQQSDAFLALISVLGVVDLKGQPIRVTVPSSIAGRTDTSGAGTRTPQQLAAPAYWSYECVQTNFDVAMKYALLDTWARFPDFRTRYMNAVYRRIALDRIMIGWYGTSAAATTNRGTSPLLQDVNIGWLKKLETSNPANFMTEGATAGQIRLGASGDFANLDQMVYSIYSMIDKAHLTGREVAMVGQGLVTRDMGKVLASHGETPTERNAIRQLDKSYGGLPTVIPPHFPDYGVMVTDPANLHLYYQLSGMRRLAKDEPAKDQVEDYISSNEAYCFGDFDGVAALAADAVVTDWS
jgi:P2 family phage major capsid protein